MQPRRGRAGQWDEAPARAHVSSGLGRLAPDAGGDGEAADGDETPAARRRAAAYRGTLEQDKELLAIFERTYGPVRRSRPGENADLAARKADGAQNRPGGRGSPVRAPARRPRVPACGRLQRHLCLGRAARAGRDRPRTARRRLQDILCNYAGYRRCAAIVVFDAYKVRGGVGSVEKYHNIHVVFTREAETADMYIEKTTHELGRRHRVRVVSSDGAEQIIILGQRAACTLR